MHIAQRLEEMLNNENAHRSGVESMQLTIHGCSSKSGNAPSKRGTTNEVCFLVSVPLCSISISLDWKCPWFPPKLGNVVGSGKV